MTSKKTFEMLFAVNFNEYEVSYYVNPTNWMSIQIAMTNASGWVENSGYTFLLGHDGKYQFVVDGNLEINHNQSGITPTEKHKVTFF